MKLNYLAADVIAGTHMPAVFRRGWSASLDLVYPPVCTCCAVELDSSDGQVLLCDECRRELVSSAASCPACAATVGSSSPVARTCSQCAAKRYRFHGAVRLGSYDDVVRSSVLRIKHSAERPLAMSLARLLANSRLAELKQFHVDAVVPVPMHWRRRLWRGINSPGVIAEQIAQALGIPCAPHVLRRERATRPQAELPPTGRLQNVRGAFRARRHRDLPNARILLVDDIMTTGATCNEAARTLLSAGAAYVAVAVIARAESP